MVGLCFTGVYYSLALKKTWFFWTWAQSSRDKAEHKKGRKLDQRPSLPTLPYKAKAPKDNSVNMSTRKKNLPGRFQCSETLACEEIFEVASVLHLPLWVAFI